MYRRALEKMLKLLHVCDMAIDHCNYNTGCLFPAVCFRSSADSLEALDKGDFILAGIDTVSLLQAVDTAATMTQNGDHGIPVPDYVEENVSTKVVKIIQSYTGVVNKMVWRKI